MCIYFNLMSPPTALYCLPSVLMMLIPDTKVYPRYDN